MKSGKKLLMIGLALAVIVFSGTIFAADNSNTTSANTSAKTSVATSTVVKVKLTEADITNIVLKLYKDAKILEIKLNGKIYIVKIQTAKGERTLQIGGNTGKVLKNVGAGTSKVKTPKVNSNPTATPASK